MFLLGTFRAAQWLQLCVPIARAEARLIPSGQRTCSYMLQLRVHRLQLKIVHDATKDLPCYHKDQRPHASTKTQIDK